MNMINWLDVQYNWRQMFVECDVKQRSCVPLVAQGLINGAVLSGDVIVMALNKCSGDLNTAVLVATSCAMVVNTFFLGLVLYLKSSYHRGELQPVLKNVSDIKREKCCYDSTIGLSVAYLAMNVGAIVAWHFLCN